MKLTPPFPLNTITQGFGKNATPLYGSQGLSGHTGVDFASVNIYGLAIKSSSDAWCYSDVNKNNPDLSRYRAVYTIVDDSDFSYEVSYGHCNEILSTPKTDVKEGQVLATVGNTGEVYVGGRAVIDRIHGDGAHLHFQVRKLLKIPKTEASYKIHLLIDGNGVLEKDGCYYQVVDIDNGYNGCVDPMQFFPQEPYKFTRDLRVGSFGNDVVKLQERLGVSPTWYIFGPKTLSAVLAYQRAQGLPTTGYVGPLTRAKLNA